MSNNMQAIHQSLYVASLALESNRRAAAKRMATELQLNHRWRTVMSDVFDDAHRRASAANARLAAKLAE